MQLNAGDTIDCAWTNGRKAAVYRVKRKDGTVYILKQYRAKHVVTFLREWFATTRISTKLAIVPRVIEGSIWRRSLAISYLEGERILEWILRRFGSPDLDLSQFASFHGLYQNEHVAGAFGKFRLSHDADSKQLREAIGTSYASLHRAGWSHGSADPRNMLFDGKTVFIIDMDHARPALHPERVDGPSLLYWYGNCSA